MACRLYLITPPAIEPAAFLRDLEAALDAGDVAAVQLRLEGADDEAVCRATARLMPAVQSRNLAFLLDRRPDLAVALGCDGVHLGPDDMPLAEARRLLGDRMIGVAAGSSRHAAIEAAEAGADYVSFGPFFPSATKPAEAMAEVDIVRWWADLMEVPCVAVGGLTVANARPLVEAGADFLAVSTGVWAHADGPAAAVKGFNDLFRG